MRFPCIMAAATLLIGLSAQQITRVAVIDYVKILVYFERDSLMVQNYQQEKNTVQRRVQQLNDEVKQLEEQLEASKGNVAMENYYRGRLESKRSYLDSYLRNQVQRLAQLQQQILSQNRLAFELERAIDLTARERGISLVLNKNDPSVLWSSSDVDLTTPVLQRLKQQLGTKGIESLPAAPFDDGGPSPPELGRGAAAEGSTGASEEGRTVRGVAPEQNGAVPESKPLVGGRSSSYD